MGCGVVPDGSPARGGKSRVSVKTNGVTTTHDVPDEAVAQFERDHRAEYERINGRPCPASFSSEPLFRR